MELVFQINGNAPSPHLGIVEAYIQEALNQVTFIELVLVSDIDLTESDCEGMIGKNATIGLGDLIDGKFIWSRFDGIIYEFHELDLVEIENGMFKYQMIIRPRLWDMNFMVRSRSFEKQSHVDVLESLFKEWALFEDTDYKMLFLKKEVYPKLDQILQTQASDLALLQQLLLESGINYFFAADKSGEKREYLKIVDNNIFFCQTLQSVIPYNPSSGLPGSYKIESFETHHRAVPSTSISMANLGDGSVQTFTARRDIEKGYTGAFVSYACNGQTDGVAKHNAATRMEQFHSRRTIYEGRSNHFAIRVGEKIKIGDTFGMLDKEVLMTSVFHHFRQTTKSALAGDNHVEYGNVFTAVKKNAEYRPDQTLSKSIIEMKRRFSNQHSMSIISRGSESRNLVLEKASLEQRIIELSQELSLAKDQTGLMVGEVIEDASVTTGNELVCRVRNDKYPDGLTVKVALGWLTQQGWLYLLPRVGVHVYFQFINGNGGQYEAVMVGYRPTASHPVPDPTKTKDTDELNGSEADPDKTGDPAVSNGSFGPLNKHRNALQGEGGVAEVAVIDGGEDSVHIGADNRIGLISKKSVNISTGALSESAGSASQQFGSLNRKVSDNQVVSVGSGQTVKVGANREVEIGVNETTTVGTSREVKVGAKITETAGGPISITGADVSLAEKGGNKVKIDPGQIVISTGAGSITVGKAGNISINGSLPVTINGVPLASLSSDALVELKAPLINVNGASTTMINGGGGKINVSGGIVRLNC